jgi:hypothetical protein
MAKKRSNIKKAVKSELKDASQTFTSFVAGRIKSLSEDIGELSGRTKRKKEVSPKKYNFNILGFLWPIISALIGIFCILLLIILLNVVNLKLENYFVSALAALFYNNLYLFFAIALFFGYADYIRAEFEKVYWIVEPVINGLGLVSVLWIFVTALNLANPYGIQNFFMTFAGVVYLNLDRIFFLFLALGYIIIISKKILKRVEK